MTSTPKYLALSASLAAALVVTGCAPSVAGTDMGANADATVMVGGAAMYPSRNSVQNAVNSARSRSSPRLTPPSPNCRPARSRPLSSRPTRPP